MVPLKPLWMAVASGSKLIRSPCKTFCLTRSATDMMAVRPNPTGVRYLCLMTTANKGTRLSSFFLFLNLDIKYKFSENPNKKWSASARNLDPFDWWWCTSHHNKHGFDLFGIWHGRGTNGTNNLGDLDNSRPGHKGHQHYLSSVWNAKTRGCYQYRSRGRRHSIQPSRR